MKYLLEKLEEVKIMGTTLFNIHVLDGDEQQIRALLPDEIVGCWSERFISIYARESDYDFGTTDAKSLSEKISQPILHVGIFDSDTVGFTIYQAGKTIVQHVKGMEERFDKMGNIPLFCETLELSDGDKQRFQKIWKKGDAEEQLWLTGLILGVPLDNDYRYPPDQKQLREIEKVDEWIAERPEPVQIKSQTEAILLQELSDFRFETHNGSGEYCSATPLDVGWNTYDYDKLTFWKVCEDGTLMPNFEVTEFLDFRSSGNRILGLDGGTVHFDSAGLLPKGYEMGFAFRILPDGGFLRETVGTQIRCASDGTVLWERSKQDMINYFITINDEIVFTSISGRTTWMERIDGLTGEMIEKRESVVGFNAQKTTLHNRFLWVAHDDRNENTRIGYALTKLDEKLQVVGKLQLPSFVQEVFHSPNGRYIYVFLFKDQVMVVDAETLVVTHTLVDKSFLAPHLFDSTGHFWIQRENSTFEAWDATLNKTLSRHNLKGTINGSHKDAQGNVCVATNAEMDNVFRIYKMK